MFIYLLSKKKKKNPLQYLFKARFFILWTLLGLVRDKTDLGYTGEGSSSSKPKKEVRFVLAKNVEKSQVEKPKIKTPVVMKRTIGPKPKKKGKSLSKSQKGSQGKHFCYHCGMQGHTRPNCFNLQALKRAYSRGLTLYVAKTTQEECQRKFKLNVKMRENSLEMLWKC